MDLSSTLTEAHPAHGWVVLVGQITDIGPYCGQSYHQVWQFVMLQSSLLTPWATSDVIPWQQCPEFRSDTEI